jgi:hypothetical protein
MVTKYLPVVFHLMVLAVAQSTVSVTAEPGYQNLRSCDQVIFQSIWLVGDGLKCPSPYLNSCFCRNDLGGSATSYISTINYNHCRYGDVDYSLALGVYNSYCAKAVPGFGQPVTPGPITNAMTPHATSTTVVSITRVVNSGGSRVSSISVTDKTTQLYLFGMAILGFAVAMC